MPYILLLKLVNYWFISTQILAMLLYVGYGKIKMFQLGWFMELMLKQGWMGGGGGGGVGVLKARHGDWNT